MKPTGFEQGVIDFRRIAARLFKELTCHVVQIADRALPSCHEGLDLLLGLAKKSLNCLLLLTPSIRRIACCRVGGRTRTGDLRIMIPLL